ncbi:hypothetical protein THAOC_30993, partial [Thalassiosira oceanica]
NLSNLLITRAAQGSNRLLFRLLPLHAASVFDAPPSTISALVSAHARAASCRDESGRLPVHLAVRNGADPAVVAALLEAHPKGALMRDREGRTPVDIAGEMSGVGKDREKYLEVLEPYMIAASKADDEDGTADEEREGVPPSASSSVEPSVIKYEQYVPATLCGVEILPLTVNLHDDFRLDRWEDESAVDRAIECEPVLPHGVAGSDRQLNVRVMEIGSVENMTLEQLDTPDPVYTDDVVVMIKCSSITREDCLARRGTWDAVPAGAYVPGTDLVGQVYSMGTEAMRLSGLEVGDRVCATVTDSANAKYVTLPYDRLIPVPRGTGPMAAIGLLSSYVPAQQCLEMAKARTGLPLTGKNVLVVGCDPVALAVLDLCMNEGACVYVSGECGGMGNIHELVPSCDRSPRKTHVANALSLRLSQLLYSRRAPPPVPDGEGCKLPPYPALGVAPRARRDHGRRRGLGLPRQLRVDGSRPLPRRRPRLRGAERGLVPRRPQDGPVREQGGPDRHAQAVGEARAQEEDGGLLRQGGEQEGHCQDRQMLQVPLHPREEGRYQSRGCFHCLPEEGPLRSQVA